MMETNKVAKNCKSVVLPSGIELTYCEFGEENEEVILSGAIYIHTWSPVLEELASRYHVYGIVMRLNIDPSEATQLNEDGTVNLALQWGDDFYQFAKTMGIEKFNYLGKCHGVNPGWYIAKNYPEMLTSFCSFYLTPHLLEADADQWTELPKQIGQMEFTKRTMRKESGLIAKMQELQTVGMQNGFDPAFAKYGGSPEKHYWDSIEECEECLKNMNIPVCMMFGTDDILFNDFFNANVKAMLTIKNAKTIILQGERHLMELDFPKRIASECMYFIEESKKEY